MNRRIKCVIALAIAGSVMAGCATPSQMIADHKMEELCAKDGGAQIYESVEMPNEFFAATGVVDKYDTSPGIHDLGFGYVAHSQRAVVYGKEGSARIIKTKIDITRTADGKLMGSKTYYLRLGGDMPIGTFQPIGTLCPEGGKNFPLSIFKQTAGGGK